MKRSLLVFLLVTAVSLQADPPAKPAAPVIPLPAHYMATRAKIAELYPDADHLPVIWDTAHDPFRYSYTTDDDSADKDTDKDGSEKPAAKAPDLDTQSLIEAGLDMLRKPKSPGSAKVARTEGIPQNDTELLKRAVAKLRIGGVFFLKGVRSITIDNLQRTEGGVMVVNVAGRLTTVKILHLTEDRATFVLANAPPTGPQVSIDY